MKTDLLRGLRYAREYEHIANEQDDVDKKRISVVVVAEKVHIIKCEGKYERTLYFSCSRFAGMAVLCLHFSCNLLVFFLYSYSFRI